MTLPTSEGVTVSEPSNAKGLNVLEVVTSAKTVPVSGCTPVMANVKVVQLEVTVIVPYAADARATMF